MAGAAAEVDSRESVVLRQLKTVPATAWVTLRDTAAFIGTSTVNTAGVSTQRRHVHGDWDIFRVFHDIHIQSTRNIYTTNAQIA